jgi:hypothetical protein
LDIFWDRVSRTICLGWLGTSILLVPTSWVARNTGMNHWCRLTQEEFIIPQTSDLVNHNFFFFTLKGLSKLRKQWSHFYNRCFKSALVCYQYCCPLTSQMKLTGWINI